MATYVTSDAHGHVRALDHALELAAPGADDTVYVLGDMIDRGPDPVGVLRLVRGLPGARVLMGNHERMMLDTLLSDASAEDTLIWEMNGGTTTATGLDVLPREEYLELIDWIANLPLAFADTVAGRTYLFSHAGFDARLFRVELERELGNEHIRLDATPAYGDVDASVFERVLRARDPEDLLWIRDRFWSRPTGLVAPDGTGPIAIAGHTPSVLLQRYARLMVGAGYDEAGRGLMVEVGPTYDTGGVADRIDIDCSAAAGSPCGQVGIMRLDDRQIWYAPVLDGE